MIREAAMVLDASILFLLIISLYSQFRAMKYSRDSFAHQIKTWMGIDRRIDREVHILKTHNEHLLTCINDLHNRVALVEAKNVRGSMIYD